MWFAGRHLFGIISSDGTKRVAKLWFAGRHLFGIMTTL